MARDWNDEAPTLAALEARLMALAPGNTAPCPIATSKQQDEFGQWGWVVDIHVRIPRVTEYEVTGVGKTFAGALRRAYLGLNNEPNLRKLSVRTNATFGVTI